MKKEEIASVLEKHAKWLRGNPDGSRAHLERAYLEGAHLEGAVLEGAHLERAHLERAYLEGAHLEGAVLEGAHLEDVHLERAHLEDAYLERAHLEGAHLERAHLERAYLERAHLEGAHLEGAHLEGAHLEGAVLEGTCLAKTTTPFDWLVEHECEMRVIGNRTLVLGFRTRNQPHMNGPAYEIGKLYVAPVFSKDSCTPCHPGLYVAGGWDSLNYDAIPLAVAFWLDEAVLVNKCRVPRFRTVADREEFLKLTAEDME